MNEVYSIENNFSLLLKKENAEFDVNKKIILLTFDDNYVNQTINLIMSISQYHSGEISYICICPTIMQENLDALLAIDQGVQVRCYECFNLVDSGNWPMCAMFRLFAPWLLENTIHKILYMDSDIICAGSLEKLLNMDTKCIAMAPEIGIHVHPYMQKMVQQFLPTQLYCNSGVCIFNLDYLRKNYSLDGLIEALCEMRPKLLFPDQDFLNFYFHGNIEFLNSYLYNFMPHELKGSKYYKKALNNCRLIHFASVVKPWVHNCDLYLMRIYLTHTEYKPMREIVKRAMRKSIFHSVIRLNRPIRRWYNDTFLVWKNNLKE